MKKRYVFFQITFCALTALLILSACSGGESPGGAHFPLAPLNGVVDNIEYVRGLIISCDGEKMVSVEGAEVKGSVTVELGRNSEIFKVEFVNEHGEIITIDDTYYTLAWRYEFLRIVSFEHPVDLNSWQFHLHGKKPGSSVFQLHLKDGKETKYASPPIPLSVK